MFKIIMITLVSIIVLSACKISTIKPDTVKVYKYDNSVSCDQSSGITIATMRQELVQRKIAIISSGCGSDGLVRAAVCGIKTGRINVFEIKRDFFSMAKKLGYKTVSTLEDYSERACKV